jgi:hypothetical protein
MYRRHCERLTTDITGVFMGEQKRMEKTMTDDVPMTKEQWMMMMMMMIKIKITVL